MDNHYSNTYTNQKKGTKDKGNKKNASNMQLSVAEEEVDGDIPAVQAESEDWGLALIFHLRELYFKPREWRPIIATT
eukprot:11630621-Ditylum_brightwellii.AAC.1